MKRQVFEFLQSITGIVIIGLFLYGYFIWLIG